MAKGIVSVSRGFNSGGYQGIPPDPVAAATPFDPEFVWNYEVGAKTQWFDNRLRLNATAFLSITKICRLPSSSAAIGL